MRPELVATLPAGIAAADFDNITGPALFAVAQARVAHTLYVMKMGSKLYAPRRGK